MVKDLRSAAPRGEDKTGRVLVLVVILIGLFPLFSAGQSTVVSFLKVSGLISPDPEGVLGLIHYFVIGLMRSIFWTVVAFVVLRLAGRRATEFNWTGWTSTRSTLMGLFVGIVGALIGVTLLEVCGFGHVSLPASGVHALASVLPWLGAEWLIGYSEEALFRVAFFVLLSTVIGDR